MQKTFSFFSVFLVVLILTNYSDSTAQVTLQDSIIFTSSKIDECPTFRTGTATSFGRLTNYSYYKDVGGTEHLAIVDNYELFYYKSTNDGADWSKEKIITGHEGDIYIAAMTVDNSGKVFIGYTIHSLFNYANPTGITSGYNYFLYDLYCLNNKTGNWATELVSLHSASNYGPKVMGLYVDKNNDVHLIANYYGWMSYGGTAWEWIRSSASNTWGPTRTIVTFNDGGLDRFIYDSYVILVDTAGRVALVAARSKNDVPKLFVVLSDGTTWNAPIEISDNIAVHISRFDAVLSPSGTAYIAFLYNNTQGLPQLKVSGDFSPPVFVDFNLPATDTLNYFRLHCNNDGKFTIYLWIKNKNIHVAFSDDMIHWTTPVEVPNEVKYYMGGVVLKTDTRQGVYTDYCKQVNSIAGQRTAQPYGPDTLVWGSVRIEPTTDVQIANLIPIEFSLEQNHPNPFNPYTKIIWQSPVSSHQTLKVYDVLGKEVKTLVNEYKPAGKYEIGFNAENLPSGVYLFQLNAGSFISTKKMILLK